MRYDGGDIERLDGMTYQTSFYRGNASVCGRPVRHHVTLEAKFVFE
jgi:hypothetical protein